MTYAENVGQVGSSDGYELWWAPVDEPKAREVLFGVGEGAGAAWKHGGNGRAGSTQWLYSEWLKGR